jgi:hypothetical protein
VDERGALRLVSPQGVLPSHRIGETSMPPPPGNWRRRYTASLAVPIR